MIRTYLWPRFLYTLTMGNPLANTARTIDRMIRQAVKRILHLPMTTTLSDDFFYIPKAEGGLGLASLADTSDFCILKLLKKMECSTDAPVQAAACLWHNQKMKSRLMRRLLVPTLTNVEISAAKRRISEEPKVRFLATYQGAGGFQNFAERCSNEWITGERMTGRSFSASIKARTNLVPTRLQTFRGRADLGDQRVCCRRCGHMSGAPESIAHISQTCAFTQGLIMRRHDAVANKLAALAERSGYECLKEPTLRYDGQTFKPDLVISSDDTSWIIDVAIPYEGREPLARRHQEKCWKYRPLCGVVKELTKTSKCGTGAIVIGARGAWCGQNDTTLKDVGLTLTPAEKSI
ncbi:hypothetical protein M514_22948 [Trichuris suis]|uniref:Reverse transcriptase zinc-binding domain-containing protein n=1 Tax=Trichuris suis TaxID=68888 RepID=A0A085N5T9_9BILA|nr:hypothetical protein M514_22948 [Trichuris suis]